METRKWLIQNIEKFQLKQANLKTLMIIYKCDARGHKNCRLGGYQSELVQVQIKAARVDWLKE